LQRFQAAAAGRAAPRPAFAGGLAVAAPGSATMLTESTPPRSREIDLMTDATTDPTTDLTVDLVSDHRPVILFDGCCNLCNGAVAFIRRHDRTGSFRFVPLDSPAADSLPATRRNAGDTLYFIDASGRYDRSTAALRIASHLDPPWSFLRFLEIVPRPWRDAVYRVIARHRRRGFGGPSRETCQVVHGDGERRGRPGPDADTAP
jgi:predicted DCC family thiol-disulfide oxidoreductase YuxK